MSTDVNNPYPFFYLKLGSFFQKEVCSGIEQRLDSVSLFFPRAIQIHLQQSMLADMCWD